MTLDDIADVKRGFRDAAARALDAGFKVIEVYAAHGFLLHQFYSPLANQRTDAYGGDFDGRTRIVTEVAEEIRTVWPDHLPLFFRLSATDWVDGGWEADDTVELAHRLKASGVDLIDCSSGGIGGRERPRRMQLGQGFQAPFAERVRAQKPTWRPWRSASSGTPTPPTRWSGTARPTSWRLPARCSTIPTGRFTPHGRWASTRTYATWKPEFGWWLSRRERLVTKLGLRDPD